MTTEWSIFLTFTVSIGMICVTTICHKIADYFMQMVEYTHKRGR